MNELKTQNNNNVQSTRGYEFVEPECNIFETDTEFKLVYDLPGIDKDDISIKIEKDVLTVTAECKEKLEGYDNIGTEFFYSSYTRSFNLNNSVDADKIGADYANGVLTLTLPKREEQKTKEIKINIA